MEIQTSFSFPSLLKRKIRGINIKRSDLSRERRGSVLSLAESVQDENHFLNAHALAASAAANMTGEN